MKTFEIIANIAVVLMTASLLILAFGWTILALTPVR
jgi:hypothetical protein